MLTETAHCVDELLNLVPDPRPALRRAPTRSPTRAACTSPACTPTPRRTSTSTPELVGNCREVLVSELAGRARCSKRPRRRGWSSTTRARAHDRALKALEHEGYHFEAADGSFELLMRREAGEYRPLFGLEAGA